MQLQTVILGNNDLHFTVTGSQTGVSEMPTQHVVKAASEMYKYRQMNPRCCSRTDCIAGRDDRKPDSLLSSSQNRKAILSSRDRAGCMQTRLPLAVWLASPLTAQGSRDTCSQEYIWLAIQVKDQHILFLLKLLTWSHLWPNPLTLPENNYFISSFLPSLVLL